MSKKSLDVGVYGSFGSIYEMEREWIQIEEGNGNKNGYLY